MASARFFMGQSVGVLPFALNGQEVPGRRGGWEDRLLRRSAERSPVRSMEQDAWYLGHSLSLLSGISMTFISGPLVRRRPNRGQSLAEFALVLPLFILVLGGIIQFGIFFWGQNTLNQVVRDTGRWAATQTDCNPATATTPIVDTASAIATQSALIGPITGVTVNWTGSPCPPTDNQDEAWVHIRIDSQVPIFFPFVPSGAIFSETEFRMEPEPA